MRNHRDSIRCHIHWHKCMYLILALTTHLLGFSSVALKLLWLWPRRVRVEFLWLYEQRQVEDAMALSGRLVGSAHSKVLFSSYSIDSQRLSIQTCWNLNVLIGFSSLNRNQLKDKPGRQWSWIFQVLNAIVAFVKPWKIPRGISISYRLIPRILNVSLQIIAFPTIS